MEKRMKQNFPIFYKYEYLTIITDSSLLSYED